MKIVKILTAIAVLASAAMSFAEPKCAHKENKSLFASTNPPIKARGNSNGGTPAVASSANGAVN